MLEEINKTISENIGLVIAALVVAMLVLVYMCCYEHKKDAMTASPEAPVFNSWPARDRAYWASMYKGGGFHNHYADYDLQPDHLGAGAGEHMCHTLENTYMHGPKSPTMEGFCGDYNRFAAYATPYGCGAPATGADCCMGQLDRPFNGASIISSGAYLRNVGQDRSDSDASTSFLPGGEQYWRDQAVGREARYPLNPEHGHMTGNYTDPRESNLMGSMFGL